MPYVEPTEATLRRTLTRAFGVAALIAVVLAATLLDRSPAAPVAGATRAEPIASKASTAAPSVAGAPGGAATPLRVPRGDQGTPRRDRLGLADGAIPDHTTVFDAGVPGVANLDAELLGAVRRAATDAARDGIGIVVNSGWRSPAYQQHLRQEAVATYGSDAEAARWVASAERSAHVSGDAVDLGPRSATRWLAEHGAAYGLCQIYDNEPWHFELRTGAATAGCPARYADPTSDPRLRP